MEIPACQLQIDCSFDYGFIRNEMIKYKIDIRLEIVDLIIIWYSIEYIRVSKGELMYNLLSKPFTV